MGSPETSSPDISGSAVTWRTSAGCHATGIETVAPVVTVGGCFTGSAASLGNSSLENLGASSLGASCILAGGIVAFLGAAVFCASLGTETITFEISVVGGSLDSSLPSRVSGLGDIVGTVNSGSADIGTASDVWPTGPGGTEGGISTGKDAELVSVGFSLIICALSLALGFSVTPGNLSIGVRSLRSVRSTLGGVLVPVVLSSLGLALRPALTSASNTTSRSTTPSTETSL